MAETAMPLKCQVGPGQSHVDLRCLETMSKHMHHRIPTRCVHSDVLGFLEHLV